MSYKDYNSDLQFLHILVWENSVRCGYVQRVSPTKHTVTLTNDIIKAKKFRTKYEAEKGVFECQTIDPKYKYAWGISH